MGAASLDLPQKYFGAAQKRPLIQLTFAEGRQCPVR